MLLMQFVQVFNKEKEMENTVQQPKEKKGGIATFLLGFLSVLILTGALGGVGYYYFIEYKKSSKDMISSTQTIAQNITEPSSKEIDELIKQIGIKNSQIKVLQEENAILKKQASNVVQKLNYVIKPKNKLVVECYNALNGRWNIPQECAKVLVSNIQNLLKEDKKIVALEVSGVVDEAQYSGFSPELKQEGLASFRARNVIEYLRKTLPSITTFEGLSVQKPNKRGFFIRAYYIQ